MLLAAGAAALEWLDYKRTVRAYPVEIYILLIAIGFLAMGLLVGRRLIPRPAREDFDGNPCAQAALGISPRELMVLHQMAEGRSNKEIARELGVSDNTVKTHVARLLEKLDARRRTEAIKKARELGIVP
jgi:DNA-binding NarL/FixJ family response regulator